MNPKLTKDQESEIEWRYRYDERLGILCGDAEPTPEQIEIATKEANETIGILTGERPDPMV